MKRRWIFILLVLALVVYFWVPMLLMVLDVEHESEPDLLSTRTKPAVTRRPPDKNTIVAERDPLGTPQEKSSAPAEKKELILLEEIRMADKDLGLTLVGTVLADDPKMNIAVIDNRSTRQQERYHEGDRIGEVLVKRIFWDKAIIETERGEELLVMSFEGGAGGSLRSSRSSSLTDLEPTVSSGPLYGGSSSSVGAATRDGGNAAAGGGGSTLGRGTAATGGSGAATGGSGAATGGSGAATGGSGAATDSGGTLPSSRSSSENSSSSSSEGKEGESSPPNTEPSVSSGPL